MAFKPAVKSGAHLRFAISGPAGSGKTFTLLALATQLVGPDGKIAVIDTEHGSASKYAHTPECSSGCVDPSHFRFDVDEPSKYDPRDLIKTIEEAEKAGYQAIVIDSLSHYWMGPGGELELVDNVAKSMKTPNSFTAWKTVTPYHTRLVDKLLNSTLHVLASMRTKTEWVIEKDRDGKSVPRKIGLQPIMRDGIEFEFDVCGDMDQENTLFITKTRCSDLTGLSINRPGVEMAKTLKRWLGTPTAQEPRGDGRKSAVQSPGVSGPSSSPAQTAFPTEAQVAKPEPQSEEIPAPLRVLFQGLSKPGYVKQGFDLLKQRLVTLDPEKGESEYKAIQKRHQLTTSSTMNEYKSCLLDMWKLAEQWAAAQVVVDDTDVPDGDGKEAA